VIWTPPKELGKPRPELPSKPWPTGLSLLKHTPKSMTVTMVAIVRAPQQTRAQEITTAAMVPTMVLAPSLIAKISAPLYQLGECRTISQQAHQWFQEVLVLIFLQPIATELHSVPTIQPVSFCRNTH
jgi:hypothetical protein